MRQIPDKPLALPGRLPSDIDGDTEHLAPLDESDWKDFEISASQAKAHVEAFLIENFGEQCADFDPDCLCCQRWVWFEYLFANPFDEELEPVTKGIP